MKSLDNARKHKPVLAYKLRPAARGAWWLRGWRWCQAIAQTHAIYGIGIVALLTLMPALVARSYWHGQILLADITVSDERPANPLAVTGFERTAKAALDDWLNHKSLARIGQIAEPLAGFAAPVLQSSSQLRKLLNDLNIDSSRKHVDVQLPGQGLGLLALADKLAHALPGHRESFEISLDGVFTGDQFKVLAQVRSSRGHEFAFQVHGPRQEAYASDSALFQALATQIHLIVEPDWTLPIVLRHHLDTCNCFDAQAQALVLQHLPRLSARGLGAVAAYVAMGFGPAHDSPHWHYTQGLMAGEIERRIHAHPGDNELRAARLVQGWLNPIQRPDPPQLLRDLAPACSSVAALLNESFGLRCTSVEPMAEALIFMRAGNLDKAWASLQRVPETSLALRLMATFLKMDQCKARQLGPCQFEPGQFGLQGAALAQANAQLRLLQASRLIELPSAQRPALLEDLRLVFGADSSSACQNLWGASPCESTMPQLTAVLEFEGARLAGRLAADHVIAASLCERAHRALPDSTGTLQCHAGALQRQGRFEQARTVWLASLAIDSRSKANALVPAFLSAGETHLGLAELDLQLGRWASAQKHLDQAKAAEDTSTTKSYWIADALVDSRASLALRQCQRGVTKHARSGPSGVLSSAMQAAQEGRWEEVRQAAQHVLETADMSDPSHEILLARAEFGLGHADVAMRRLRSTIKRWPEAYDAPRWLYHMRRQSGAWALAGDDAERKLLKLSGRYVQAMDQGALVESRDMYQDFDDMNYFHDCRLQPVGVRRASAAGPGRDVHRAGQLRRPHRTGP